LNQAEWTGYKGSRIPASTSGVPGSKLRRSSLPDDVFLGSRSQATSASVSPPVDACCDPFLSCCPQRSSRQALLSLPFTPHPPRDRGTLERSRSSALHARGVTSPLLSFAPVLARPSAPRCSRRPRIIARPPVALLTFSRKGSDVSSGRD
jgi:hypothetical protein